MTRAALLGAGLTSRKIQYRIATGRLHPVHRGVYALGHPRLAPLARELAAVLACGPGTLLSHRTAAALRCLLPERSGPVHVTRAGTHRAGPDGITVHQVRKVPPATLHRGLPVTSTVQTLLDLAATEPPQILEQALNEAHARRLATPADVLAALEPGRRGAATLRAMLEDGPALTRSEAERRLLSLVARAGLPRPLTNVRVGRFEVDAFWPAAGLIVEVDGYAYHSSRTAFERDRLRDAELQAAGHRVVRVTWRGLTERPEAFAVRLAMVLGSPRPGPRDRMAPDQPTR